MKAQNVPVKKGSDRRQLYEQGCRLLVLLHRRGAVYLLWTVTFNENSYLFSYRNYDIISV